jgi:hypothetical protein
MDLRFPGLMEKCVLNKTDWYLKLPNGSEIWFGGLDEKERTEKILGMEFATIFFNESSQIPYASVVLALTRLAQKTKNLNLKCFADLNPPSKLHWTYLMFIEKKDPVTKRPLLNEFDYAYYAINPKDNIENLDPKYIKMLEALPERARNRFLLGLFADDTEGALWTVELLAQNRKLGHVGDPLPDWLRVVIAIDPSGSKGKEDARSDEIGITVVALGTDNHGYLLEDLSGSYRPEEWGQIVVEAYNRHSADKVIGEVNYGGDMVRAVVHAADPNVPYGEVRATRGKVVRAEPISMLYEQKKIHHVGFFPELEDQLCAMTMSGYQGMGSPDRGDSLIWGITELFPQLTKKMAEFQRMPKVRKLPRNASRLDTRYRAPRPRRRA